MRLEHLAASVQISLEKLTLLLKLPKVCFPSDALLFPISFVAAAFLYPDFSFFFLVYSRETTFIFLKYLGSEYFFFRKSQAGPMVLNGV